MLSLIKKHIKIVVKKFIMKNKITIIPLEGSSGKIPTGAMQFNNDWPGYFIRGDDAISLMLSIESLMDILSRNKDIRKQLVEEGASFIELEKSAEQIRKNVLIQSNEKNFQLKQDSLKIIEKAQEKLDSLLCKLSEKPFSRKRQKYLSEITSLITKPASICNKPILKSLSGYLDCKLQISEDQLKVLLNLLNDELLEIRLIVLSILVKKPCPNINKNLSEFIYCELIKLSRDKEKTLAKSALNTLKALYPE